jgi:hypothetical protein
MLKRRLEPVDRQEQNKKRRLEKKVQTISRKRNLEETLPKLPPFDIHLLPRDLIRYFSRFLSIKSYVNLSLASKQIFQSFRMHENSTEEEWKTTFLIPIELHIMMSKLLAITHYLKGESHKHLLYFMKEEFSIGNVYNKIFNLGKSFDRKILIKREDLISTNIVKCGLKTTDPLFFKELQQIVNYTSTYYKIYYTTDIRLVSAYEKYPISTLCIPVTTFEFGEIFYAEYLLKEDRYTEYIEKLSFKGLCDLGGLYYNFENFKSIAKQDEEFKIGLFKLKFFVFKKKNEISLFQFHQLSNNEQLSKLTQPTLKTQLKDIIVQYSVDGKIDKYYSEFIDLYTEIKKNLFVMPNVIIDTGDNRKKIIDSDIFNIQQRKKNLQIFEAKYKIQMDERIKLFIKNLQ